MKEIRQHIDKAYGYLAKIPVNGDFVEVMAIARQELREAYELTGKEGANGPDHRSEGERELSGEG